jgi:hypothetical protein
MSVDLKGAQSVPATCQIVAPGELGKSGAGWNTGTVVAVCREGVDPLTVPEKYAKERIRWLICSSRNNL